MVSPSGTRDAGEARRCGQAVDRQGREPCTECDQLCPAKRLSQRASLRVAVLQIQISTDCDARPSRLSLPSSQATASAKARWISSPMMRMLPPSLFVQIGSWRATRHLLIRAHDASGKAARGGHVMSYDQQPAHSRASGEGARDFRNNLARRSMTW
jgi:hypothetical protein